MCPDEILNPFIIQRVLIEQRTQLAIWEANLTEVKSLLSNFFNRYDGSVNALRNYYSFSLFKVTLTWPWRKPRLLRVQESNCSFRSLFPVLRKYGMITKKQKIFVSNQYLLWTRFAEFRSPQNMYYFQPITARSVFGVNFSLGRNWKDFIHWNTQF